MFPTIPPRAPFDTSSVPPLSDKRRWPHLRTLLREIEAGKITREGGAFSRYLRDGIPFNWNTAGGRAAEAFGLVIWVEGKAQITDAARRWLA